MAIEKKWPDVAPRAFSANGSQFGVIALQKTNGFKVKQTVTIGSSSQPTISLEVKRVYSDRMIVGPKGASPGKSWLQNTKDLSAYLVSDGSYIYTSEDNKNPISQDDINQATYEQEPTVARRVILVDESGNFYDSTNPLPVSGGGGGGGGGVVSGDVRVVYGENALKVNPDGSINVNIAPSTSTASSAVLSIYGAANAVISGVSVQIISYTVPVNKVSILEKVEVSGENIANYQVLVNGIVQGSLRTYFGSDLNLTFDFITGQENGFVLIAGDVVSVRVYHTRPTAAEFDARIQVCQITKINPDFSVNETTNPSTNTDANNNVVLSIFSEALSVISGSTTQISSYTVPSGKTSLIQRIEMSGQNIARFQVSVNGVVRGTLRTYFGGSVNTTFDFVTGQNNGFSVSAGDIVSVSVLHNRPVLGNFEARMQVLQISNS